MHPLHLETARNEHQAQALWLVLAEQPEAGRAALVAEQLNAARRGRVSLAGLVVALRGSAIVGAAWAYPAAGQLVVVWPPQLLAGEAEETADRLLAHLHAHIASLPERLAQALLPAEHSLAAERLLRAGFTQAAGLVYVSARREIMPAAEPKSALEFVPYDERDSERLAEIIERTYQGTLDCPALDGLRRTHEVLAGYRECGEFQPARWSIVREAERDVGCLLLTAHAGGAHWELVYFGLVPEARGRGFGRQIICHALWQARAGGAGLLLAAVDALNEPALRAYTALEFSPWDRRFVFLKLYPPPHA